MKENAHFETAARLLNGARMGEKLGDALPESLRPTSTDDAYAIQDLLVELFGGRAAGFKVGSTAAETMRMLGISEPFRGIIMEAGILSSPANLVNFAGGQALVEAEFVFKLQHVPHTISRERESLLAKIDTLHVGIEVCRTAYCSIKGRSACDLIADDGVAAQLVLGPAVPEWSPESLVEVPVQMLINNREIASGDGKIVMGSPLSSLLWLMEHILDSGRDIAEGTLVATGSCTGMAPICGGDLAEARFGSFGSVLAQF